MAQTIFDHIKNITIQKGEYLGDEGWNNWMINRFLSMKEEYVELVNIVQKHTWRISGKDLYNLYKEIIPKEYVFLKYIKSKKSKVEYNKDEIDVIKEYFEISEKEAKEYIDMLDQEYIDKIKSIYGK